VRLSNNIKYVRKTQEKKKKKPGILPIYGRNNLDKYEGGVKFSLYWAELKMDSAR
jgi:hypothetical protein